MANGARAVPAAPGRELKSAGAAPVAMPAASGRPAASARPARTASRRATSGWRLSTGTESMAPASMSASTSTSLTPEARAISAAVKTSGRIEDWSTPCQRQKGCPRADCRKSPQVAETTAKCPVPRHASSVSRRGVVAPGQGSDTSRGQRGRAFFSRELDSRATSAAPPPRTRRLRVRQAAAPRRSLHPAAGPGVARHRVASR